jgi:hypothetical protein
MATFDLIAEDSLFTVTVPAERDQSGQTDIFEALEAVEALEADRQIAEAMSPVGMIWTAEEVRGQAVLGA